MAIIDKPSDYFNTKLYTGNGSTQSITGVGFQPDWVFFKQRTGTPSSSGSQVYDVVRGATKYLSTHATNAEATQSNGLTSFDSDGFSIGNTSRINGNTESYVAWNWKAGTSFTNDASATGIGSIDSAGSVNTDAGFSIVSYTGTGSNGTLKHGLSSAPKMIIVKNREATENWLVYHQALGNTSAMKLNLTSAKQTTHYYWNNTSPTSSTFSLGASSEANTNADGNIAYCFAEKQGFSKFSKYQGNNSSDGTFLYFGFAPSFVMIKRNASGYNWYMFDNKRDTQNTSSDKKDLDANNNSVEATDRAFDWLSNGIKFRDNNAGTNASDEYIYMAFAENPFVTSTGVPACAR